MADASERIMTDDTAKEIVEALKNIPGVVGATPIARGGTGATTKEDALRNLGAQPEIGVDVKEELGKMVKSVNSITPDASGNINIVHVRTAENLTSDDAQDIYGEFIERTTGGTASLTDGKSWIGIMEGNSIRTGHVDEQKSVQVNNMPRTPITASIDWTAFRTAVNFMSANEIFSYDGTEWSDDLEDYGVTVVGYPIAGDTVTVSLTAKSERMEPVVSDGVTVTIDWPTYEAIYTNSPITFFSYASGAWNTDMSAYGITVTGSPQDGDVINIYYTPEVHSMYVNPAVRGAELAAYVNWDTFKEVVGYTDATVTLNYTTDWSSDLNNYGVSISGSPIKGDSITLYFTAEVRGQIVNSTPTGFVSTGWNLYNHGLGYARVLKYDAVHGFKIAGTYTGIAFATDPNGDASPISVDSDGDFQIPEDGYIIVTGGNATDTMVYMTWSDWTDGTPLPFAPYSESVIDLTGLMQTNFPYGLCAVGSAVDDIDFSNKIANSRVERLEYTVSNLALVQASGREYAYDDDYIYAAKATPTSVGFSLSMELDAYDHGLELVTGTTVPVFIHMLYGQNLRDKLRTDVVTISQQVLTSAQKQQIRENLGLGGSAELPIENGGTGANTAAGARTALGLGAAALKGIAASIANTDTGLPTAAQVNQAINSVNGNIGNSKIINSKYYTAATTLETVQNDIDSAIAPYVESGKPKFMQFGYMNTAASQSLGLKSPGVFVNVFFNGSALVLVEFVGIGTLNEINYMKKVTTWGEIVSSLNSKLTEFTTGVASIGSDYSSFITSNSVQYTKRADGLVLVYGSFHIQTQIASEAAKAMFTGLPTAATSKLPNWVSAHYYQDKTVRRMQFVTSGKLNQLYSVFPVGDYEIIPFMYFST